MSETTVPTKAQAELLTWLIEYEAAIKASRAALPAAAYWEGRPVRFRGGDLINFYHERSERTDHHTSGARGGGYASHGWRRSGGTALANLAKRGFLTMVGFNIGVPEYRLTDEGRTAERQYRIEVGEVRDSRALGYYLVTGHKDGPRWWASFSQFPDNCRSEIVYAGELRKLSVVDPADYPRIFGSRWPWPQLAPAEYEEDT